MLSNSIHMSDQREMLCLIPSLFTMASLIDIYITLEENSNYFTNVFN